jgi:hypothetical protein
MVLLKYEILTFFSTKFLGRINGFVGQDFILSAEPVITIDEFYGVVQYLW